MKYRIPDLRKEAVEAALDALVSAQRVVLTTHLNADGDGCGCEAALAIWLRSRGKEVTILNPTGFPGSLAFLLPDRSWSLDPGSARGQAAAREADLVVVLDTGEEARVGRVMELIRDRPRLVVDHHPPGEDNIEGISLRDPRAAATGELLYDLLTMAGDPWPDGVALGLYVAILTDTGSFRFSNSSPAAHRVAADLLERGVDPEAVYRRIYGTLPLRRLRLLHASLEHLEADLEAGLAWMTIPAGAYEALGAGAEDVEGLVDYPRDVEGVEAGLLFRQVAKGGTKVSFRSNGALDVNALARRFGGGGHVKASGALLEAPLPEARGRVLDETRKAIRAMREEE